MAGLLEGKNIVVMGVANQRSIAWGIAKSLAREGANLIFTNRQERSYKKLVQLLDESQIEAKLLVRCDVASDESIEEAFSEIQEKVGTIHGVVHSRSEEHTSELQSRENLVCRLLL